MASAYLILKLKRHRKTQDKQTGSACRWCHLLKSSAQLLILGLLYTLPEAQSRHSESCHWGRKDHAMHAYTEKLNQSLKMESLESETIKRKELEVLISLTNKDLIRLEPSSLHLCVSGLPYISLSFNNQPIRTDYLSPPCQVLCWALRERSVTVLA